MLETLGLLVRNLVVVLFITSLLEMLVPHGQFYRYLRMVTGLIVMLMVVGTLGVLLNRFPEIHYAGEKIAPALADTGRMLQESNRQQALAVYRASLADVIREEIEAGGKWRVTRVEVEVNEDPESISYGSLLQVGVTVAPVEDDTGRVEPVNVEPVHISGDNALAEDSVPATRVAALEEALARRLQLDPSVITVSLQGRS